MTKEEKIELADKILAITAQGQAARCYQSAVQPRPGQPPDPQIIVEVDPSFHPA